MEQLNAKESQIKEIFWKNTAVSTSMQRHSDELMLAMLLHQETIDAYKSQTLSLDLFN